MKKILLTGAGSYIGQRFVRWLSQYPGQYQVSTLDMLTDAWREKSFSGYDAVFHVAGVAHQNEKKLGEELYRRVNYELAAETAEKAKADGAKQFIFLSTVAVYGQEGGKDCVLTRESPLTPVTWYGKYKLLADLAIQNLTDVSFSAAVLRPPMVYGAGCRGNFTRLVKLVAKTPIFPAVENQRSMLYIDHLCEFVRLLAESGEAGLFFPQNAEYVSTREMVELLAKEMGKKIRFTGGFNFAVRGAMGSVGVVRKMFGSLTYEKSMSEFSQPYSLFSFAETIRRSVNNG